ncbi:hypothetical protein ISN41_09165 [Enterobacter bugandensis]|uniref:hypothetical protein n=1 Tax=Enterobacter TaxID=547 RepID=UPI0018884171|nr:MULTISPECIES: hypothetical protein [Enterobacter]MBF2748266.1 hypothetical protein [Enterobacter bugandensis]MBF2800194.1 hypothetical protein [Enterobacter bugandensis]
MTTETLIISRTWQQISDGTQTKSVQVLSGVIQMVDSDTAPSTSAAGHVISDWVSVTPPTKAWVRATGSQSASVAVS